MMVINGTGDVDQKNVFYESLTTFEDKTFELESAVSSTTIVEKPTPVFSNLDEILSSDLDNSNTAITTIHTTINILRPYLSEGLTNLSLWSRAICSRTVLDLESSSLADSFVRWDNSFQMSDLIIDTTNMKNTTLDNSLESSSEVGGGGGGRIGGESLRKKKEDEKFIPACRILTIAEALMRRVAEGRNIGK